jgi:hypothetical protein
LSEREVGLIAYANSHVPLLAIRRPGDPPPTLTDRQRAIVESFAALVRPVDWT